MIITMIKSNNDGTIDIDACLKISTSTVFYAKKNKVKKNKQK